MMGTLRRSEEKKKDEIRGWSAAEALGSGRVRLADGWDSVGDLITSTEMINNKHLDIR